MSHSLRFLCLVWLVGWLVMAANVGRAQDLDSPSKLREAVRSAFEQYDVVGFRCETRAWKSSAKSPDLFPFSIEQEQAVISGQRFHSQLLACSRADHSSTYEMTKSEFCTFGDESNRLDISWHDVAKLRSGQEFGASLLKETSRLKKGLPEIAYGAVNQSPLSRIAVLNGKFPGYSKTCISEYIDDRASIDHIEWEHRDCIRVDIKRDEFEVSFDFCPSLGFAVVGYRVKDFFESGRYSVREMVMKNPSSNLAEFELYDSYREVEKDGNVTYQQKAILKYTNVRTDVVDSDFALQHKMENGTPVQIDKTPFLDAAWEDGDIVLTHNERIVNGMAKAELLPSMVANSGRSQPKTIYALMGVAIVVGLVLVAFRRK